jgi:hypothetical protein
MSGGSDMGRQPPGNMASMEPDEWIKRWADGEDPANSVLVRFATSVVGLNLAERDRRLLTEAGLPKNAAPWLTFDARPGLLSRLRDTGFAPTDTAALVEIGFTGSADPICLDSRTGTICVLNHDDNLQIVFANSSVGQLVEFLDLFRTLVRITISERGSDAYLNNDIPPAAVASTIASMRGVDPDALEPGTMWHNELLAS